MTLPQNVLTWFGHASYVVLHLINNIYRQKQAGLAWYAHIPDRLQEIGFQSLKNDKCVFVHGKCLFFLYADGGIFMSSDKTLIDKTIGDMNADSRLRIRDTHLVMLE